MNGRRAHHRCRALLFGVALAAGACGVPDDREPRVISADDAPLDLDPTDDEGPASGPAEVRLYFVGSDEDDPNDLVPIARAVDDPSLDVAVDALLAASLGEDLTGPDDEPLSTQVPPETVRLTTSIDNEVATINLGCAEGSPPDCGIIAFRGQAQLLLFGQLACTADSVRGVSGVRFQHQGEPQPAPLPSGESTIEPVRCFDYD